MKNLLLFFNFFLLIFSSLQAQNKQIDSLRQIATGIKDDTNKVKALRKLGKLVGTSVGNYDTALILYNQALNLSQKINYKQGMANCYTLIGYIYWYKANYPKAQECQLKSIEIREGIGDKKGIIDCNIRIGNGYFDQAYYPQALTYYLKALKIGEEIKYKPGIGDSYLNIGNIYFTQANYPQALTNYLKALKISDEIGNKQSVGLCYTSIGAIYNKQANYSQSLINYFKALEIKEEIGDKNGAGDCYSNIGNVYADQANYPAALFNYLKALKLKEEMGDKIGIGTCYNNIGTIYYEQHKYNKALDYYLKSFKIREEVDGAENLRESYKHLAEVYNQLGRYKEAYENYVEFKTLTDSIFNEENTKELSDMKTDFEVEKKATELKAEQDKKDAVANAEKNKQRIILFVVSGFLLLVAILAGLIFRNLRTTQKQKLIIEAKEHEAHEQNILISEQKNLIEERHKEITDSINYAERIQKSFLATKELLDENLREYFVFFQPKDVVSGDFYWAGKLNNGRFALVTADSTGHGVPGAIMSLLNITSLEKAVENLSQPAEILNHTRNTIIERLKKDGSADGGKDGMDCSFISFDFKNNKLTYSAANNPVWIVRQNSILEFQPDKMPVGKHDKDSISFTQHEVDLQKGDVIYTITDGMPDQFGGPNGKKYKYKQLKELFVSIPHLSLDVQKAVISDSLNSWKGDLEQVDDITIIGVRI